MYSQTIQKINRSMAENNSINQQKSNNNSIKNVHFFEKVVKKNIFPDNRYDIEIYDLKTDDNNKNLISYLKVFRNKFFNLDKFRSDKLKSKRYIKKMIKFLDLNNPDDLLLLENTIANRFNQSKNELDSIFSLINEEFGNIENDSQKSNYSLETNWSNDISNDSMDISSNSNDLLIDKSFIDLNDENKFCKQFDFNDKYNRKWINNSNNLTEQIDDYRASDVEFKDTEYDNQLNSDYDIDFDEEDTEFNKMNLEYDYQNYTNYDNQMNFELDNQDNLKCDNQMNFELDNQNDFKFNNQINTTNNQINTTNNQINTTNNQINTTKNQINRRLFDNKETYLNRYSFHDSYKLLNKSFTNLNNDQFKMNDVCGIDTQQLDDDESIDVLFNRISLIISKI